MERSEAKPEVFMIFPRHDCADIEIEHFLRRDKFKFGQEGKALVSNSQRGELEDSDFSDHKYK